MKLSPWHQFPADRFRFLSLAWLLQLKALFDLLLIDSQNAIDYTYDFKSALNAALSRY